MFKVSEKSGNFILCFLCFILCFVLFGSACEWLICILMVQSQVFTPSKVTSTKNGDLWVILEGWPAFPLFTFIQMRLHNQENEVTLDLSLFF